MARKVLKEVMFEEEGDEEFEICIKCGKLTTIKKTDNIVYRSGYIEGAGQLCFSCGQNTIKEWTQHG
jgi:hypothetical protein